MKAAHRLHKLRSVEASAALAELLIFAQVVKELTTIEEIHDKVELGGRLERIVQLYDEGAVNLLKDVTLSLCLDEKIALGDHILAKLLQREIVLRACFLY